MPAPTRLLDRPALARLTGREPAGSVAPPRRPPSGRTPLRPRPAVAPAPASTGVRLAPASAHIWHLTALMAFLLLLRVGRLLCVVVQGASLLVPWVWLPATAPDPKPARAAPSPTA